MQRELPQDAHGSLRGDGGTERSPPAAPGPPSGPPPDPARRPRATELTWGCAPPTASGRGRGAERRPRGPRRAFPRPAARLPPGSGAGGAAGPPRAARGAAGDEAPSAAAADSSAIWRRRRRSDFPPYQILRLGTRRACVEGNARALWAARSRCPEPRRRGAGFRRRGRRRAPCCGSEGGVSRRLGARWRGCAWRGGSEGVRE